MTEIEIEIKKIEIITHEKFKKIMHTNKNTKSKLICIKRISNMLDDLINEFGL